MSDDLEASPKTTAMQRRVDSLKEARDRLDRSIIASFERQHPGSDKRNWPEDFSHENGMYECICLHCRHHFLGYKRRMCCKTCSTPSTTTEEK